eukprot:149522_1
MMATTNEIFAVCVSSISLLLMVGMMVSFLYHSYEFKKYKFKFWKVQLHVIITALAFLFFALFALHTTIDAIVSIVSQSNGTFNYKLCLSNFTELTTFSIGKLLIMQYFVVRLFQVFNTTPFAVSITKLKITSVLITIPVLLQVVHGIYNAAYSQEQLNKNTDEQLQAIGISSFSDCTEYTRSLRTNTLRMLQMIGITLYVLNELIYSIFILRTFVGKILLLSMPAMKNFKNADSSAGDLFSQDLLMLAIKTTNLVILSVFSGLILLIKFGGRFESYVLNFEGLINCLAIYLSFGFTTKLYNGLFHSCHNVLFKPCIWCCFCCCLSIKLPKEIELQYTDRPSSKTNTLQIDPADSGCESPVDNMSSADSINQFRIT